MNEENETQEQCDHEYEDGYCLNCDEEMDFGSEIDRAESIIDMER